MTRRAIEDVLTETVPITVVAERLLGGQGYADPVRAIKDKIRARKLSYYRVGRIWHLPETTIRALKEAPCPSPSIPEAITGGSEELSAAGRFAKAQALLSGSK